MRPGYAPKGVGDGLPEPRLPHLTRSSRRIRRDRRRGPRHSHTPNRLSTLHSNTSSGPARMERRQSQRRIHRRRVRLPSLAQRTSFDPSWAVHAPTAQDPVGRREWIFASILHEKLGRWTGNRRRDGRHGGRQRRPASGPSYRNLRVQGNPVSVLGSRGGASRGRPPILLGDRPTGRPFPAGAPRSRA